MREEAALIESELVALIEKRERAVSDLQQHIAAFVSLEESPAPQHDLYDRMLAVVQQICAAILTCEQVELTREEIGRVLEPARRVHERSPFVGRSCQSYALSRAIAQQHRNRVQHQAARILQTLLSNPRHTRIASLACGSSPDLRLILTQLPALTGKLWLSDADPAAIDFTRDVVRELGARCELSEGDAVSAARRLQRNGFELVVCGTLCDELEDRHAVLLLQMAYRALAAGGVFFFTNIARGNPYRPLIEYFGGWTLVERSEEDVYQLCAAARIGRGNVRMRREETGLALLVEVTRLE